MENRTTIMLNILLLFLVSLEPYLFNMVSLFGHVPETPSLMYASVRYALDMAGLVAILAFFTHELATEERRLIAPELLRTYKSIRNYLFLAAGIFLLTMFPQFWEWRIIEVPLRFYLWVFPLVVFWLRRGLEGSLKTTTKEKRTKTV